MAFLRKLNLKAKAEINTGFGTNASDYGGRFVNKNGQANIKKRCKFFGKNKLVPCYACAAKMEISGYRF
jgi:hypothetical protein